MPATPSTPHAAAASAAAALFAAAATASAAAARDLAATITGDTPHAALSGPQNNENGPEVS